ncbi:MAG: alpha/beta hydrolase [Luteolibacter sp.]
MSTAETVLPPKKKRRWLRRTLAVLGVVILILLVKFIMHLVLPRNFRGSGEILPIELLHGHYQTLYYNETAEPLGIVIVGTGDGGWSYWEENVAKHLVKKGYAVGGWDCRGFADTRQYDQAELAAGFRAAVEAVRKRADMDDEEIPVWYGGWSTGAEQSVAAAADPERPPGLVGLLLAAPGEHGRYGITEADLLGVEPSGPGSFALADLAPKLTGLRIVQFAAGLDPLDDTTWQNHLGEISHKVIKLPNSLHDMGGAGPEFLQKLDEAMKWTLSDAKK